MKLRDLWIQWMPFVVIGGIIAVLAALIAPAVQQARDSARKSTSRNNLKQLGIAFHNYHEAYGSFPTGGLVDENDVAFHGWFTFTTPYLDASPLYSMVNFDYPWTDPENAHLFRNQYPVALMPSAKESYTSDGFALLHYLGNPNVLHRNSSVKLEDMDAGATHTWFLAEVAGNYQPWSYPFNWRPLGTRLNAGADSFGRPTEDGAFFLMGDGSVEFLQNDTDPAVLQNMVHAPPIAPADLTTVPVRNFEYGDPKWTSDGVILEKFEGGEMGATAHYNPKGVLRTVFIDANGFEKDFESPRPVSLDDLRRTAAKYPDMRELVGAPPIDNRAAQILAGLKNLEFVQARFVAVTETGLADLKRLPHLRVLRAGMTAEMQKQLTEALTGCELQNTGNSLPESK